MGICSSFCGCCLKRDPSEVELGHLKGGYVYNNIMHTRAGTSDIGAEPESPIPMSITIDPELCGLLKLHAAATSTVPFLQMLRALRLPAEDLRALGRAAGATGAELDAPHLCSATESITRKAELCRLVSSFHPAGPSADVWLAQLGTVARRTVASIAHDLNARADGGGGGGSGGGSIECGAYTAVCQALLGQMERRRQSAVWVWGRGSSLSAAAAAAGGGGGGGGGGARETSGRALKGDQATLYSDQDWAEIETE
jgi:hypothetical protein